MEHSLRPPHDAKYRLLGVTEATDTAKACLHARVCTLDSGTRKLAGTLPQLFSIVVQISFLYTAVQISGKHSPRVGKGVTMIVSRTGALKLSYKIYKYKLCMERHAV